MGSPAHLHPQPRGKGELVQDWVLGQAPTLHPAFNTSRTSFETQRATTPTSIRTQLDTDTDDFLTAVELFEEASSRAKGKTSTFDVRGRHTWDEVMQAANYAEQKYVADAMGKRHAVRKFFRITGDYASTAKLWIGLLPNDKYMSFLCGGLTIIFTAAGVRSDRREQILEAFDEVPETILRTQQCREVFSMDHRLRDCALDVYISLLHMIEGMILILVEKSTFKKIRDSLRGPRAEFSLDLKIRHAKERMAALLAQVEHLKSTVLVHTDAVVTRMEPMVANTQLTVDQTHNLARDINYRSIDAQSRLANMGTGIDDLSTRFSMQEEMGRRQEEKQSQQYQATTNLAAVLEDIIQIADWNKKRADYFESQVREQHEARSRANSLQRSRILDAIATDETHPWRDIDTVTRRVQAIEQPAQAQAHWLLRTPRFHSWLSGAGAGILLVDGNSANYGSERISPMSLLSSLLVQNLQSNENATVLHFFCGMHNTSSDPLAGPSGMIRSLVGQLLASRHSSELDLEFVNNRAWRESLQQHDLAQLARLFHEIVRRLPETTLFLLIDGISLFEVDRWAEELFFLVHQLQEVVADGSANAVLKLLMTSAGVSRVIKRAVPEECYVWCPADRGVGTKELNGRVVMREMSEPKVGVMRVSSGFGTDDEDDDDIYSKGCE